MNDPHRKMVGSVEASLALALSAAITLCACGGGKANGGACGMDSDCSSGICQHTGPYPLCSAACTADSDCTGGDVCAEDTAHTSHFCAPRCSSDFGGYDICVDGHPTNCAEALPTHCNSRCACPSATPVCDATTHACRATGDVGATCSTATDCTPPLRCPFGTCAPVGDVGAPCHQPADCTSANCGLVLLGDGGVPDAGSRPATTCLVPAGAPCDASNCGDCFPRSDGGVATCAQACTHDIDCPVVDTIHSDCNADGVRHDLCFGWETASFFTGYCYVPCTPTSDNCAPMEICTHYTPPACSDYLLPYVCGHN